jgi:CHASE2 domain-containing sensor protein
MDNAECLSIRAGSARGGGGLIEGTPQHGSGIVHLALALVAFTAITIGAILISAGLMSDPTWRPAAPVLLALSVAGAVAYLLLGAALKHHHAPVGLYERIFLGLELLWIAVAAIAVAVAVARRTPGPVSTGMRISRG